LRSGDCRFEGGRTVKVYRLRYCTGFAMNALLWPCMEASRGGRTFRAQELEAVAGLNSPFAAALGRGPRGRGRSSESGPRHRERALARHAGRMPAGPVSHVALGVRPAYTAASRGARVRSPVPICREARRTGVVSMMAAFPGDA